MIRKPLSAKNITTPTTPAPGASRGAAWRKKRDRGRALQDYAEAVRLDPSDNTAAANHRDVAQEVERLGSLTYQKNLPSFNCATAKRQVEKAICASPDLANLDREVSAVNARVIQRAATDPKASALRREQDEFLAQRSAAFGRSDFDLLKAMRERNPELKIIFVSGYAEDAFEKSLPENQQFAFLPKPFTLSQLVAAVKETMIPE